MDIKGFKTSDGTVHKYDYGSLANIPQSDETPSEGTGGYYTPVVTQPDDNILQFDFTPSDPEMPVVEPVQVTLPEQDSGTNVDQSGKTALDTFLDNTDVDYAYDVDTGAYYTVIRIYKQKLDGSYQYPFVYAPNGADSGNKSTYDMAVNDGWLLAINGGVFNTTTKKPDGIVIQNGVVIQNAPTSTHSQCKPLTIDASGNLSHAAYDADAAELATHGIVSAVCGFIPIIVDYEKVLETEWNSVSHYTQNVQRQIIGQWGNGDYAIITCEGRNFHNSDGWTIAEAQNVCMKHGLKFAYNLDGGGSTETMLGKKHINTIYENTTGRIVPTFIVFNGSDTFGAQNGEVHIHSYASSVAVAATCETPGVRTYTCSCGGSYTEVIPATGHNYVDGVCSDCGAADPDVETEKTLTGISATYSGGDVIVGTAVDDLTGIVVVATYSDDSTATVTEYTLSGTIAEGMNTLTVSYGGMTTTFVVTGYIFEVVTANTACIIGCANTGKTANAHYWGIDADADRIACVTTEQDRNDLAGSVRNDVTYYPIPIPSAATKVTIVCPGLIAGDRYWTYSADTQEYTSVSDPGWGSEGRTVREIEAGVYEYLTVNFKDSVGTNFSANYDTSGISITFE